MKRFTTHPITSSKAKRISIFALAAWLFVVISCSGSWLANAEEKVVYTDDWLDMRYDWVFHVTPGTDRQILDYPGSGLRPVSKVSITYRINPRLTPGKPSKRVEYEDLYFSQARAIGCRRRNTLDLKENWQGAICFQGDKLRDFDQGALASTVARLAVDALAKKCVPIMVLVPPGMVVSVASEMKRFNFARANESAFGDPTGLFLVISSGANEDRQFLIFRKNRN